MSAVSLLERGVTWLVVHSRHNMSDSLPTSSSEKNAIIGRNGLDFAIFSANAITAGTPLHAWCVGPLTIGYGLCRMAFGVGMGSSMVGAGGSKSDQIARRHQHISGLALIAGGAAGYVPWLGTKVNASLAGYSLFEGAVATMAPVVEPKPLWVT